MSNDLLKYINEYFNTFNIEDYTICVNGTPTRFCKVNTNSLCVIWNIPSDNNGREFFSIYDWEIAEVSLTVTTMVLITKSGKEYVFTAKVRKKEERVKNLLMKIENILLTRLWAKDKERVDEAVEYLYAIKALMDE